MDALMTLTFAQQLHPPRRTPQPRPYLRLHHHHDRLPRRGLRNRYTATQGTGNDALARELKIALIVTSETQRMCKLRF